MKLSTSQLFLKQRPQRKKLAICDRCMKDNCRCQQSFLKQIRLFNSPKNRSFNIGDRNLFSQTRPSSLLRQNKYFFGEDELLFSGKSNKGGKPFKKSPSKPKSIAKPKPKTFTKKGKGGLGFKTMSKLQKKHEKNKQQAKAKEKIVKLPDGKILTGKAALDWIAKAKAKQLPHGGFTSAQAQKDALKTEFEKNLQQTPQFFPETLQTAAQEMGALSPELNERIQTGAGVGQIALDPLVDGRFNFERLYPKQTSQLIDLGRSVTDKQEQIDNIWKNLNDNWDYTKDVQSQQNKFAADTSEKLVKAGADLTALGEISKTQNKVFGIIPNEIALIAGVAGLGIGLIALVKR